MSPYAERLVDRLHDAEEDLKREVKAQQRQWRYRVHRGRVWFDKELRETHRKLRQSIPAYILEGSLLSLLTAPVIYSLLLPLVMLDLWVTLYQWICFPIYGVARVPRRRYFALDRHKLAYLNGIEKVNCTFCSYANGLIAYVREVAARTEQSGARSNTLAQFRSRMAATTCSSTTATPSVIDTTWGPCVTRCAVPRLERIGAMHRAAAIVSDSERQATSHVAWLSWLLGAALLVAVIAAALHFSEERAFVRVAQETEPWWLAVAVLLQAGTYIAQGGIWRLAGRATACPLSRWTAVELSLAKLFADQALPSAGLSSSILIAKALERRQFPSAAVKASVLINIASYHLAYVFALAGALSVLTWHGQGNALVVVTAMLFLLFSIGLSLMILAMAGRPLERVVPYARRLPLVQTTLAFLRGADGRLVRNPRVLGTAIGLQGAIVLLDAATVWTLIGALGVSAPVTGVFASFMIASPSARSGLSFAGSACSRRPRFPRCAWPVWISRSRSRPPCCSVV